MPKSRNLEERNRARAQALGEFEGTRTYCMQYRGFPGDRDAEMQVDVTFRSTATKSFTVVSESGSKFIIDHVFKKLLEGEEEAQEEGNRERTALNTANYDFTLDGYEVSGTGARYVLSVAPKTKSKFLYVGKIWVDAADFAVHPHRSRAREKPVFLDQEKQHPPHVREGR